jgi:hypothetical protein
MRVIISYYSYVINIVIKSMPKKTFPETYETGCWRQEVAREEREVGGYLPQSRKTDTEETCRPKLETG